MRLLGRMVDGMWLVLLAIYVFIGIDDVPFHGDETTIIFMSHDYHYLVHERDLEHIRYRDINISKKEQKLRITNGTISKMAIGFAWDVAGMTVDDIPSLNDPTVDLATNIQIGNHPSDRMLRAARWSSALMLVVSAWAVVGITWLVAQAMTERLSVIRLAAWIASAVYITTPVVLLNGRRAMFEGAFLCFVNLMVLAATRLVIEQQHLRQVHEPTTGAVKSPRKPFAWAVLTGVLAGFAIASKHTAVIAVLTVFIALFTEPLIHLSGQSIAERLRDYVLMRGTRFVTMGLVALGVFLFLTPAWWTGRVLNMPEIVWNERSRMLAQATEREKPATIYTPGERINAMLANAFWVAPEYAESPVWRDFPEIREQIVTYKSLWYAGRQGGAIEGALLIVAFCVGLVAMLAHWRNGSVWLTLNWLAISAIVLLFINPLNWQRYYDPLSSEVAIVIGIGVAWVGGVLPRWLDAWHSRAGTLVEQA